MEFRKYQHVERFGTTEVENIELGTVSIFSKIDGTNASIWLGDDGVMRAGSRNRELSLNSDNAGFMAFVVGSKPLNRLVIDNPTLRFYGEWLVPHSLRTYEDNAWRNFYIFDVIEELGEDNFRYLSYDEYKLILDQYEGVKYIPPIMTIRNTNYEQLIRQLEKNTFLIKDGCGSGEGIVIKNYDYKNKYGRTTWAKIVTNEFKAKHAKGMCGGKVANGKRMIEESIADKYVTRSLCEKVRAKIELEKGDWSSKYIPQLLNTIYYDVVNEEAWNFVKEHKNPTINFRTLFTLVSNKVKELMPELL